MLEIIRYNHTYQIPEEVVRIPGHCTIDFGAHLIRIEGEEPERLTNKFLILLAYFYQNKNQFLSPLQILHHMFPQEITDRGAPDQVKPMVYTLRKKLRDKRPFTIIVEERGYGYKFVLQPDGRVSSIPSSGAAATAAPSTTDIPTFLQQQMASRRTRVVTNLEMAMNHLVEADTVTQLREARLRIYRAIKLYIEEISFPYFMNMQSYQDGAAWVKDSEEHDRWLIRTIHYCLAQLGVTEQSPELLPLKQQLLHNLDEWHIIVELLAAQLDLEREALELSGDLIKKETRQARIDKLEEDYHIAQAGASAADAALQQAIDKYTLALSADTLSM